MCFVFIWEQRATFATYSINWLVFITEVKSVYSVVRIGSLKHRVINTSKNSQVYIINNKISWIWHTIQRISRFPGFLPAPSSNNYPFGVQHNITIACSVMLKTSNIVWINEQGNVTSGIFIDSLVGIYIYTKSNIKWSLYNSVCPRRLVDV